MSGWFLQRGWTFWQTTATTRGFLVGAIAGGLFGGYVIAPALKLPFVGLGYVIGMERMPAWILRPTDVEVEVMAESRRRVRRILGRPE